MRGSDVKVVEVPHSALDSAGYGHDHLLGPSAIDAGERGKSLDAELKPDLHDAPVADGDKDARIDIEAAMKAVDTALAGLRLGEKRQTVTTPPKQPDLSRRSQDARVTRAGAQKTGPKVPRRHSAHASHKGWGDEVNQLAMQDALQNMRQQNMFPEGPFRGKQGGDRFRSGQTSLSSGSGSQFNMFAHNGFGSGGESAKSFSELHSPQWGNSGFGSPPAGGWNMQYVQSMLNQHGINGGGGGMGNSLGNSFLMNSGDFNLMSSGDFLFSSGDFNVPSAQVPSRLSLVSSSNMDFLLNSGDSFASRVEMSGDSFTCKMETPIMDTAYIQSLANMEQPVNKLPESLEEQGGGVDHHTPSWKALPDIKPGVQMDAKTKSEQALLLAIAGILKCALEGNLGQKDLLSDLNFLIVSVRRHLTDYQNLSKEGAQTLLMISSTLPVVCRTANFKEDVVGSLRRFMDVISPGHPLLQKQGNSLKNYNPKSKVEAKQQSEVRHLLTRIHRKLTGGSTSNGVQHVALALFESSGDLRHVQNKADSAVDMESRGSSPKSFAFSLLNTRTTQGSISPRYNYGNEDDDDASSTSGFSFISCDDEAGKLGIIADQDLESCFKQH